MMLNYDLHLEGTTVQTLSVSNNSMWRRNAATAPFVTGNGVTGIRYAVSMLGLIQTNGGGCQTNFSGCRFDLGQGLEYPNRSGLNAFPSTINFGRHLGQGCQFIGSAICFIAGRAGQININYDIHFDGDIITSSNNFGVVRMLYNSSLVVGHIVSENRYPIMTGSVTGRRFIIQGLSLVATAGGGPNYFPGTIAGVVTPDSVYS